MVLQRLQTVYLLIAALLLAVFAFFPALTFAAPEGTFLYGALERGIAPDTRINGILLTLDALIVVLLLITIFKYRDLNQQLRLCAVAMGLIVGLAAVVAIVAYKMSGLYPVTVTFYNLLPAAALVMTWLARRGVAHDKKLLSDSERIR